jgi:hypothetical protein
MDWGWSSFFMEADSHHLKQRKMMRRGTGPQGIGRYNHLFESEVTRVAMDLQTVQGSPLGRIQESVNAHSLSIRNFINILSQNVRLYNHQDGLWRANVERKGRRAISFERGCNEGNC